jgi:molybdenum cofactor synthesis domain-containing protein
MRDPNWSQRAILIAVGTEVTSGQIKNSHGTFLASQLGDYGVDPVLHIAVPDDEKLMLEAFATAEATGALVFITGGLGPTRDDFTRDVVAKWLGLDLIFDNTSWSLLNERLTSRKVVVSENHKRQCFYPKGSMILNNQVGTAHGFYLEARGMKVWTLPGPTPELHSIWNDHIRQQLSNLGSVKKYQLLKWKCLGLPESELADLVEEALKNSQLETGYRLVTPFVEAKVWIPIVMPKSEQQIWIDRLESSIGKYVILKDETDQALRFLELLGTKSITVVDRVTGGLFAERLCQTYRDNRKSLPTIIDTLTVGTQFDTSQITSDVVVELSPFRGGSSTGHNWDMEVRTGQGSTTYTLTFESKAKVNPDRIGKVAIELALQKLIQIFKDIAPDVH